MRPVCVKCNREMNCEKNEVIVYHLYEKPTDDKPVQEKIGNMVVVNTDKLIDPQLYEEKGRIDFIAYGDKYKCPTCGMEIITGFGQPLVDFEVPQEQLQKMVKNAKETVEIRRRL